MTTIDTRDYVYLCGNCGKITAADTWEALVWDDDHEQLVPAPDGAMDPTLRCPACSFDHTDDDSSPGVWDGTEWQVRRYRRDLLAEPDSVWGDAWSDE
jgi:DNA-directed RNA polymerase subunit RPC12/RpoP